MKSLATETFLKTISRILEPLVVNEVINQEPDSGITYLYAFSDEVTIHVAADKLHSVLAACLRATQTRKAAKSLDESTGKIRYKFTAKVLPKFGAQWVVDTSPHEVKVTITAPSVRCKLRKVTNKMWMPPTTGHYVNRDSYEIENPEECLGVSADALVKDAEDGV